MAEKKWWEDGVRFECQGSAKCCVSRGRYGFVYMTTKDRERMAKVLGMTPKAFTRKYCTKDHGDYYINDPEKDCLFLDDKRCTVYEGRPEQCRTWPFWPENMSARTWSKEIRSFCPGVGKGRLHSADEIRDALRRDPINPLED